MIDVPVRVKDALRTGNKRKNYIFNVYENFTYYEESSSSPYTFFTDESTNYYFYIEAENDPWDPWTYKIYNLEGTQVDGGNVGPTRLGDEYTAMMLYIPNNRYIQFDMPDNIRTVVTKDYYYVSDEYEVIDNDHLVKESVKFDERMCSGDQLKFGLCEGASLEFQAFGIKNISGMRIQAFIEVEYVDEYGQTDWHTIPMGWFTVQEVSRQASTGILKITAYNKLKSEYLDAKANLLIEDIQPDTEDGKVTISTIQSMLLQDFQINEAQSTSIIPSTASSASAIDGNMSFKFSDSSTTYYMGYEYKYFAYRLDDTKRIELDIKKYVQILRDQFVRVRNTINSDTQTPTTTWTNFLNSQAHRSLFTITMVYGTGNLMNGIYTLEVLNSVPSQFVVTGLLEKLKYVYGVSSVWIHFPVQLLGSTSRTSFANTRVLWNATRTVDATYFSVKEVDTDDIDSISISLSSLQNMDVTLRDIVQSNYELHCVFGQLDRQTDMFRGIELNHNRLYPAESLYPADTRYPLSTSGDGQAERVNRAMYSKLWADENNVRSFRFLYITYKGIETDPQTGTQTEVEKVYQQVVNNDGTDDYVISNNWLFKNLVWSDEDIEHYALEMQDKLWNITWFPFELWCAGLPYIETGDEVEINLDEQAYTSYVLRRSLNGIQNLQDDFINGTLDIF